MSDQPSPSPEFLVAQMLRGQLSPQQVASTLAHSDRLPTDGRPSQLFPSIHWQPPKLTPSSNHAKPLIEVASEDKECLRAVAQLQTEFSFTWSVRIVSNHLAPRDLAPSGLESGRLVLELPHGEPFPQLVDRLGWPPPKPIVLSWLTTLETWRAELMHRRWPIDFGYVDELVVSETGDIIWPWMPFRIVQSMLQRAPSIAGSNLLEAWAALPATESRLDPITRMSRLISFDPASPHQPVDSTAFFPTTRRPTKTATKPSVPTGRKKRNRYSKKHLAITALVASVLLLAAFLSQRNWRSETPISSSRSNITAKQPGSAGLFSDVGSVSEPKTVTSAKQSSSAQLQTANNENQLSSLLPTSSQTAFSSTESTLAELGIDQVTFEPTMTGATVDLQSEGFAPMQPEAVGPDNSANLSNNAISDSERIVETPKNSDAAIVEIGSLNSIDLPPRDSDAEVRIPFHNSSSVVDIKLEFPSVPQWILQFDGSPNHSAFVIQRTATDATSAIAKLTSGNQQPNNDAKSDRSLLGFSWTELAGKTPTVESLRNGRIVSSTETIYLRSPITIEPPPVEIASETTYAMQTPPDPANSLLNINIQTIADNPENKESQTPVPIYRWLTPIEASRGKKHQGLLEFALAEENPVAVRQRINFDIGRQTTFSTISIATLDGGTSWFAISEDGITSSLDRLSQIKTVLSQQLTNIQQLYSDTSDSDRRAIIRKRRDLLEQQQESAEIYGKRFVELQKLAAKMRSSFVWDIQLSTTWPDANQPILITKPQR